MSNLRTYLPLLLIPTIILLSANTSFAPKIRTATADEFQDITEGDDYYISINYLREQGIIDGYEDNTFKANQVVNRAEALKMITRASNIFDENTLEESDESPFIDALPEDWYTKYLIAAKEKGIINGYEDSSFKPEQNINLAETLKMLFESYGDLDLESTSEFLYDDTPADSWFSKYSSFAGTKGIINVYKSNTVSPEQEMTRGYLAEVIYRTMLQREGYEFGKATWYFGVDSNDGNIYTAAHKYLPFGSKVQVTNLANGKSIEVEITDRGPYGPGRVLDLSKEAFAEIAWTGEGVIKIEYKVNYLP